MRILLYIQSFLKNTVDSLATLLKVILWNGKVQLPKTVKNDLVILGNGPSLQNFLKDKLSFLEGKQSLAVNHFADTEVYSTIKPDFYIINVPEFWTDQVDADVIARRDKLLQNLVVKTQWDMHLLLGRGAQKSPYWKNLYEKNPHLKLNFFNPTPVEGFKWFRHFCYRRNCGMPRPHNVLIPALMLGINMGFKNLYITGADHSWLEEIFVADDNTVYLTQRHFYDAQTARPDVMKKTGKDRRRLHEILHKFMLSFKGYFDIQAYAKAQKVHIYNITPNSFIDAFERQKIS